MRVGAYLCGLICDGGELCWTIIVIVVVIAVIVEVIIIVGTTSRCSWSTECRY